MVKISLILPNFNGVNFIQASIDAFLNSDWENKELVIVDGMSTDGSHEIISKYSGEYENIKWVSDKDKGISDAINIGIDVSSGDIIGYLGGDDLILKDTLSTVANYYSVLEFDALYFDSYSHCLASKKTHYRSCPDLEFNSRNLLKFGTIVGLQNIYFKKRIFEDFRFNVSNMYSMDYEFYFEVLKKYNNFLYVNKPSTINLSHDNISNKLAFIQRKESFLVAKRNIQSVSDFFAFYLSKRFLLACQPFVFFRNLKKSFF